MSAEWFRDRDGLVHYRTGGISGGGEETLHRGLCGDSFPESTILERFSLNPSAGALALPAPDVVVAIDLCICCRHLVSQRRRELDDGLGPLIGWGS